MLASLRRAPRLLARAGASPAVSAAAVRAFAAAAGGKKGGDSGSLSHADITKTFLEMDAAAGATAGLDIPVKLTGRSGELTAELYAKTSKAKTFDKAVKELEGFVAAIQGAGMVVDRFFSTANYSPEECQLVMELLLTNKEALTSFETVKNADVKDLLIDNSSNMDAWRGARKAVQDLKISDDVKQIFEALAEAGRLDLVKKVAEKAGEVRAVTAKSADAVVTSAVPLTKEQQAAIAKALPNYAPAGSNLNTIFTVDPALLGGLLVSIKNQTIDLSATSRLVDVMAASRSAKL